MKTTKWIGFDFERDGWSETHENRNDGFIKFVKDFRSDVKSMLKGTGWAVDSLKGNSFDVSGFLYNETKNVWVYFSTSDVRHWQDKWNEDILVRTADSNTDYSGHANNSTSLKGLADYLQRRVL